MEFSVLPVAGGLYDQHPRLLEEWQEIFAVKRRHEEAEQARRNGEMEAQKARMRR